MPIREVPITVAASLLWYGKLFFVFGVDVSQTRRDSEYSCKVSRSSLRFRDGAHIRTSVLCLLGLVNGKPG